MYVCYHITRQWFRSNNSYLLFLFIVFTVFMWVIMNSENSYIYTSNYAFIIGIAVQQHEKTWMKWASQWGFYVIAFIVLTLVSVSYINRQPLFRGFSMIGVPLYVSSFIFLSTRIPTTLTSPLITFFSRISYEMYLFQGVSILLINHLSTTLSLYLYVLCVLGLNVFLAFISHQITNSSAIISYARKIASFHKYKRENT